MLGRPRVRYVQKRCVRCGKDHRPEAYHQLVPPHANYAFDLIAAVGVARFRSTGRMQKSKKALGAREELLLPSSTINELAHAFLDYLAATHQARAPQLRKRFEEDGGYVLHVDGTCEPGTDTVFNVVAGNRGWTLAGAKMSGEDVKQIAGLLRRCVESFGTPLALVRDLSPQIEAAGKEAIAGVLDLICHYHFLENVGSKLCERPHAKLTAGLRRWKIQAALRSSAKGPGPLQQAEGLPFSRAGRTMPPIAATPGRPGPAPSATDGGLSRFTLAGGLRGRPFWRIFPV